MSERRPAPAGEPPRSVAWVVRRVHRDLGATLAVESLLLFAAAALVARASAVLSGAEAGSQALVLLCGALCALTWWLERAVGLADTARALDERLRHRGALTTAFEVEGRERAPTAMEELVRRRVLARLRVAEARRALFPSLLVPVGAPVAAGVLFWAALDARGEPPGPADLGVPLRGFQEALARGAWPATPDFGEPSAEGALEAEMQAILARSRALRPPLDEERRRELQDDVAGLERDLARVAASLPEGSERRESLEEARGWLDALQTGLAGPAAQSGGGSAGAEGTGGDPDGTISRSNSRPSPPPDVPMPRDPSAAPDVRATPVLGLQSGNGWPKEYDGVVRRWIELSRLATDGAGGR